MSAANRWSPNWPKWPNKFASDLTLLKYNTEYIKVSIQGIAQITVVQGPESCCVTNEKDIMITVIE